LILHQKAPIDRQITPLFWAFNVLRIINLRIVLLSTLLLSFAAPALADPTVGLGLTLGFGGGQPQAAVGLRVFSDNMLRFQPLIEAHKEIQQDEEINY
jgi:hypothetical protein